MYQLPRKIAVVDIETNLNHDTIWCAGVYHPRTGTSTLCTTLDQLYNELSGVDAIAGHNLIGFDLPVLRDVWGFDWNRMVVDSLVLGRLLNPSIDPVFASRYVNGVRKDVSLGNHSLAAWSRRAGGRLKMEFNSDDFDGGLTSTMAEYCLADCSSNWDVLEYMVDELNKGGFSTESIELEHEVRRLTTIQERNGFKLDFPRACALYTQHKERMDEISTQLQQLFPPIIEERWSEKTGKRLKDKVTVFNVGSRQQVADRLTCKGAIWSEQTPSGKPKVDETTLKQNDHIPEASLVLEYLTLQKRSGMLKSWIDACTDEGRVHGRVNTCGAVTGRMSHSSPNMAQIPSEAVYRRCWTVQTDNKLVGVDASGLELRMLAHYMQDDKYTDLILNGDIHSYNQELAGLPTRNDAKTFIYALLYGAGDAKLGSIVDGSAKDGAKLRARFMRGLPAYAKLQEKIARIMAKRGTLPGLDGRQLQVRSEHSALNTLLQSAGAIVMKKALVIMSEDLKSTSYKLVAQVHDEMQMEVPEAYAEDVGRIVADSIRKAGEHFDMRCPLAGEYQVGDNWSQTH